MEQLSPTAKALLDAGGIGWAFHPDQNMDVLVERSTGCVIDPAGGIYTPRSPQIHHEREDRVDVAKFRAHVRKFEDYIQYMYRDSEGYVTVGLGHKFENVEEAKSLVFWKREIKVSETTRVRADAADVETAFNAVKKADLVMNSKATAFKNLKHNNIDLDINEIERLFISDVREFVRQLQTKKDFSDFDTYPAPVQLGMLDLLYTIGFKGFFGSKTDTGFEKLAGALKYRNWIEAAEETHRVDEDEAGEPNENMVNRNKVVRGWFLEAVKVDPFFVNPRCTINDISRVRGYIP